MPQFRDKWKKSIFHFEKTSQFASAQVNITPLIDVVFLLLLFFMLTSTFVSQSGIKVNLPRAVSGKTLLDDRLIITIDKKDGIFIDGRKVTDKEISSFIAEAAKDKKAILIMADKTSSMGKTIEIWDMCCGAGVNQVNIATKNSE